MTLLVAAALAADLLVRDARVWDGVGAAAVPGLDVLVRDDTIVAIGPGLEAPEGALAIDARGGTVIPGLIDAHVHLSMTPGAGWRPPASAEDADLALRAHLRAYLAVGVTTIVDPGVRPDAARHIREVLAAGAAGPRYLHAGPPVSPPGGYVTVVVPDMPSVADAAELDATLDASAAAGAMAIKVTLERGFLIREWPLHSDAMSASIRAAATERDLPLWVHAVSPEEQRRALAVYTPDLLVHALDRPHLPTVRRVAKAGVPSVTTLAAADSFLTALDPARFDDPDLERLVPAEELATARDRDVARRFRQALIGALLPGAPKLFAAPAFFGPAIRSHTRRAHAALRALRDAGAPLVMGSDAGNWPMIPYLLHGPSSIRELELLVAAGLTPHQALTAGTVGSARALGLTDLGPLAPGRRADLVVLDGDPLTDLGALRRVRWTIHDGVARSPASWLTVPRAATPPVAPPPDCPWGQVRSCACRGAEVLEDTVCPCSTPEAIAECREDPPG